MAKVCDDCLTVAYDNGIDAYDDQVNCMIEAGNMIEDHMCSQVEEPEIKCACACH